ncbi:hypothetical protein PZN02_002811 [Sinorhizobium garamanticum]|uniref:Uncharacterized protein n=1 Tax=Sinorhizobium garamanticum TaxID=680247 RepID=A0ABY8DC29_9HYPH|nr:hypothetical protein [Sinorhizobium garamanticum]WEX86518.1 hypothetical protein PZN02_002811 [Sinorhizobium garamanticum]
MGETRPLPTASGITIARIRAGQPARDLRPAPVFEGLAKAGLEEG